MIKRKTKDGRLIEFVFNENELIEYLVEYEKINNGNIADKEEIGLIADYVMSEV